MKIPKIWLGVAPRIIIRLFVFVFLLVVLGSGMFFGLEPVGANTEGDDLPGGDVSWTVIYDLLLPLDVTKTNEVLEEEKEILKKDMLAQKQDHAYDLSITSRAMNSAGGAAYQVSMQGKGIQPLRQAIYQDMRSIVDPLGGAILVQITGSVLKDESIEFAFESNNSTGYIWQVLQMDGRLLQPDGETFFETRTFSIGAPQKQIIPLKAVASGQTSLLLVYRRTFEPQESITRRILISGKNVRDFSDLSDVSVTMDTSYPPEEDEAVPHDLATPVEGSLPAAFDWRDQNKVTPVRNQRSCGSCWAFATVATMEGAMLVQGNGPNVDLSEQFLVSCNLSGWSCNGGWRAHPYHQSTLGKNQTKAGAVLEADFPYINANGTCDVTYSHPYKIASWSYVDGYSIPSVEAIKQAIYTYGPVTVSVCTGPAFSAYRGGIFATNESGNCGSYLTNHAVTLVGWNDADDTWIMKNSWGTWWGESGYMRIKRTVSNIGYAATYVIYSETIPAAPKQISPTGVINTTTPSFVWTNVPGAKAYQIQIDGLTNEMTLDKSSTLTWVSAADVCEPTGTTCRITPADELTFGNHEWYIKLRDSKGVESMWSSSMAFEVSRVPKQVYPKGDIFETKPTFKWNKVSGATEYKLQVNDANGVRVFLSWLDADDICKPTQSTCRVTPDLDLPIGVSKWYVKSRDAAMVESLWSNPMLFTVRSMRPIALSPIGTSDSFTPVYTWTHVVDADYYVFRLSNLDTLTLLYEKAYSLSDLGCANGEVTCSIRPDYALSGSWITYYWKVEAKGTTSTTRTSEIVTINSPPAPEKVTALSPSGAQSNWEPTFRWNKSTSPGVFSYEFYYARKDNGTFILLERAWYNASDICDGGTCSITPDVRISGGEYIWWVRARNPSGKGNWNDPMVFTTPPMAGEVTALSPSGSLLNWKPDFRWEKSSSPGVFSYEFYFVKNDNGTFILLQRAWYNASDICEGDTCSINPGISLYEGEYSWWVRARNPSGKGEWNDPLVFTLPGAPSKTILISPTGAAPSQKPEYRWEYRTGEGITQYMLYIVSNKSGGNVTIHEKWYPVETICKKTICAVTPDVLLESGTYTWWVRARNPSGKGKWSDPFVITRP